jgi:putative ABC transport system permease protein
VWRRTYGRRDRDGLVRGSLRLLRLVNLRHLRAHPRRTLLTVIGIAASIALVTAITTVNATLRDAVDSTTHGLAGDAPLEVAAAGSDRLPATLTDRVRLVPGVAAAVPIAHEIARIDSEGHGQRTLLYGVGPNLVRLFPGGLGPVAAQLARPGFQHGILLSQRLADRLHAEAGGTVAITTSTGPVPLPVAGVLDQGPFASVNGGQFGLLALPTLQRTFRRPGTVDAVYLMARAGSSKGAVRAAVQRRVGPRVVVRNAGGSATAYKRTFDSIAGLSEQARSVALFVAIFLVLNTMSMALAERREEIAILTFCGASRGQLIGATAGEAAVLGAVGGIAGILLGALLAHLLIGSAVASYNILPITASGPLAIGLPELLVGLAGGVVVSVGGALLASGRILRATPADALRLDAAYEWGARAHRAPRFLVPTGLAAIGATALMAWLAPVGAHVWIAGAMLACALAGLALLLPTLVPLIVRLVRFVWQRAFGLIGRLAAEALAHAPGRATIAAGALALTAAVVVAVGAGLGSYRREVDIAASAWYSAPLYVNADGAAAFTSDQPLSAGLRTPLAGIAGVAAVYPIRFGVIDDHGRQLLVYAMPVAQAAAAGHRITSGVGISQRQLVTSLRAGDVIVSRLTARERHLRPGDTLAPIRPFGRLRVGGLFNDVASFDSLYMEYARYVRVTGDRRADRFAIVSEPGVDRAVLAQRIQRFLTVHRVPATVLTGQQMSAYVLDAISSLFALAQGIEIGALFIAAMIVLNTMLRATSERQREFGIQRAIGMRRSQLAGSVVLEGIAVSIVGVTIAVGAGIGLGFLMTLVIEHQLAWRIAFHPLAGTTALTAVTTIAIGAAASLYPSVTATRRTVVELLGER